MSYWPTYNTNIFYSNAYGTNMSATSSVTGARTTHHTKVVSISARPIITYVRPNYDEMPRMWKGYTAQFQLEGYNFDTDNLTVYLSTNNDVYADTNELSGVSAFNLFGSISGSPTHQLSAMYPAFSGIKLPNTYYVINSHNTMTVTVSAPDNIGKIDIIVANVAGYAKFSQDLTTKGLAGSGVERVIEIKNPTDLI